MAETYNTRSGTFDDLVPGDLFFATGTDGKTYSVPWSEMESVGGRLIPVLHVKNIRSGTVTVGNHDFITDLNGNKTSQTSFSSGEWLVYGDYADFEKSTGDWDFGPKTKTHTRKNFHNLLNKCNNFNGDISHIRIDVAEDVSYMFGECYKFNQPVTHFDTSRVNTMRAMFRHCYVFNQPVNHFNTSACENFMLVFQKCKNFNQPLSNWDVDHGVNFLEMFNEVPLTHDIGMWNTERAENMSGMFWLSTFNGDISKWNTSNVTNMDRMFYQASKFNGNTTEWCVTKIPTKPAYFNFGASSYPQALHPRWGTCPRGEDGSDPIEEPEIDQEPKPWDDKGYRYHILNNTEEVDLGWTFSEVWDVATEQGIGPLDKLPAGSNVVVVSTPVQGVYFSSAGNFEFGKYTDVSQCRIALSIDSPEFNSSVEHLNFTSEMTQMLGWYVPKFNQDVSHWDVSRVTRMNSLWSGCSAFNQPLAAWDVSSVVWGGFDNMFNGATAFDQDISNWCVTNQDSEPQRFDQGAGFEGQKDKQPQWGTCP